MTLTSWWIVVVLFNCFVYHLLHYYSSLQTSMHTTTFVVKGLPFVATTTRKYTVIRSTTSSSSSNRRFGGVVGFVVPTNVCNQQQQQPTQTNRKYSNINHKYCLYSRGGGSSTSQYFRPIRSCFHSKGLMMTSTTTEKIEHDTSKISIKNDDDDDFVMTTPPVARRDETLFVYAGVAPPESLLSKTSTTDDHDDNDNIDGSSPPTVPIRQAESSTEPLLDPPIAVSDPYGWLRDETRTNVEVLQHLKHENAYTKYITQSIRTPKQNKTCSLVDELYNELLSYVQETDYTCPYPDGMYWYYKRTYKGKSYPVYCRSLRTKQNKKEEENDIDSNIPPIALQLKLPKKEDDSKSIIDIDTIIKEQNIMEHEQVLLDVNEIAIGTKYCSVSSVDASPSGTYLAYGVDCTGDEKYHLFVRHIETNTIVFGNSKNKSSSRDENNNNNDKEQEENDIPSDDIVTSEAEEVLVTSGSIVWGADDTTLFYTKLDDTHRPYQVWQKRVTPFGETKANKHDDILIYEDLNDTNWIGIEKSSDEQYLFISSSTSETSEIWYMKLVQTNNSDVPASTISSSSSSSSSLLQCIAKRRPKVLYEVDHRNGLWWISSNVNHTTNMALYTSPAVSNCEQLWSLVVTTTTASTAAEAVPCFDGGPHRCLDGVQCFQNHVIAVGREHGLPQIWILHNFEDGATTATIQKENDVTPSSGTTEAAPAAAPAVAPVAVVVNTMEQLTFPEDAYDVGLGYNCMYNETKSFTISYSSLIQPPQSILVPFEQPNNMNKRHVLKERNVPGYNPGFYSCERRTVLSRDGTTQIPISIVYKKSVMEQHLDTGIPVPVHLYGYGSYGICMEADYDSKRLPLLERGIVYVIAHVRGGSELGRQWYEEPNGGKYLCKLNTFYDFLDVSKWLVYGTSTTTPTNDSTTTNSTKPLSSTELLSCEGRSAGGLLIGACINMNPELYKVAILGVPFVDVVPTMIDSTIPLTAGEWEEWGNPNEMKFFNYMMSYSPTSNVQTNTIYPSCLLTGGLHDPRVQYWEPTKLACEIRYKCPLNNSNEHPICVKMDMSAGHFSASDRYKYLKEQAFDYGFLLQQLGLS